MQLDRFVSFGNKNKERDDEIPFMQMSWNN